MAGLSFMKPLLVKSTLCKSTVLWRCFLLHGKNPEIIHSNLLAFLFFRLNQTVGDPKVSAAQSLLHPFFFCDPAAGSTAAWVCLQLFSILSAAEADRCWHVSFLLMHSDNQTSTFLRQGGCWDERKDPGIIPLCHFSLSHTHTQELPLFLLPPGLNCESCEACFRMIIEFWWKPHGG